MATIKPVQIQKRGKSYQLYYYTPKGERRRISVGHEHQMAQRMAVKFTDWLMEGKDPESEIEKAQAEEKTSSITIHDFFQVFMERHGSKQSESMQEIYKNCFKNICRCTSISKSKVGELTKGVVLKYMYMRIKEDKVTAATVNREASFLRCMLSRATDWEVLPSNPLNGLRLLKEAEKREVNLKMEQAEALVNLLKEPLSSIVELAIYSGFRRDNILKMRIEDIRFHDLTPTGEVELLTKGNKRGIFPLGTIAVALLKRVIGERKTGYVFINPRTGNNYECVHCSFDRAVKKLDLKVGNTKLRFHDLRHVFATWLHREGVSLDILRPLLGHSNRSSTDRYTTIDRLACGKALSLLPQIRRKQA